MNDPEAAANPDVVSLWQSLILSLQKLVPAELTTLSVPAARVTISRPIFMHISLFVVEILHSKLVVILLGHTTWDTIICFALVGDFHNILTTLTSHGCCNYISLFHMNSL